LRRALASPGERHARPGHQITFVRAIGKNARGVDLAVFHREGQRKPTFVFVHYPLIPVEPNERSGYDLHGIIKKQRETVQHVISGHWHKWFEFGRSYGPPHLVIAATRYDLNAYLIVEADPLKAEHRLLNTGLVDWNTHFSSPWKGQPPAG
jgi:hypothetical protein